jgi:hypothetical protein
MYVNTGVEWAIGYLMEFRFPGWWSIKNKTYRADLDQLMPCGLNMYIYINRTGVKLKTPASQR